MIRFISSTQTLPLRSLVLRDSLPLQECIFDQDDDLTTFHLGFFTEGQELACILSCQKENHGKLPHDAYRLRGMATHPHYHRRGYARELLGAAENHIKTQLNIDYLWFNAREVAFAFYLSQGFEFMSDMFEIPGIGPHKEMFKLL